MAKTLTMTELMRMQEPDLLREIEEERHTIAKLNHAIRAGSEKNTHLLQDAKKQLARMLTVLSTLRRASSALTMPAPNSDKRLAISDKLVAQR